MRIDTGALVSNSDIIANYKSCREKAEHLGKIFIIRNNQPDAVLFSFTEYERLSVVFEYLDSLEEKDFAEFLKSLSNNGNRRPDLISR